MGGASTFEKVVVSDQWIYLFYKMEFLNAHTNCSVLYTYL